MFQGLLKCFQTSAKASIQLSGFMNNILTAMDKQKRGKYDKSKKYFDHKHIKD